MPRAVVCKLRVAVVAVALAMSLGAFGQQPTPSKPTASPIPLRIGIEILTDPQGVDLNSYIRAVFKSVKDRATATLPASVSRGEQGVVSIRAQIQKDGSILTSALPQLVFGSGKKVLDDHAMASILKAVPFEHLPEAFPEPSIELRFTFYYNTPQTH